MNACRSAELVTAGVRGTLRSVVAEAHQGVHTTLPPGSVYIDKYSGMLLEAMEETREMRCAPRQLCPEDGFKFWVGRSLLLLFGFFPYKSVPATTLKRCSWILLALSNRPVLMEYGFGNPYAEAILRMADVLKQDIISTTCAHVSFLMWMKSVAPRLHTGLGVRPEFDGQAPHPIPVPQASMPTPMPPPHALDRSPGEDKPRTAQETSTCEVASEATETPRCLHLDELLPHKPPKRNVWPKNLDDLLTQGLLFEQPLRQ